MNHYALTRQLRRKRLQALRARLIPVSRFFVLACILPLLAWAVAELFPAKSPGEFAELEKAVALISTIEGTGTAFLISTDKLLTARHVVENMQPGDQVELVFENIDPQRSTTATLKWLGAAPTNDPLAAEDFLSDIAVLQLDDPAASSGIPPLSLGDSDLVTNLTPIVTIGYPGSSYSITRGDINNQEVDGVDLFKLDAATNPGNSGGPVIGIENRELIGMLVGSRENAQGENVAIKVNNILAALQRAGINLD